MSLILQQRGIALAAALSTLALTGLPQTPATADESVDTLRQKFGQSYRSKDWHAATEYGLKLCALDTDSAGHAYNLACVFALDGKAASALEWLDNAAKRGFANVRLAKADTDLATIRDDPKYGAALVRIRKNLERKHTELKSMFEDTKLYLFVPPDYDEKVATPLIIALHGYGGTADELAEQWRKVAGDAGAILVAPQAVHPVPGAGYSWTGEDRLSADEADYLVDLTLEFVAKRHKIDRKRVVLTGFSQGGFVALAIGPRQPYRFAGVIPMSGGYIPNLDAPPPASGPHPPRFYFMVGENDRPVEQMRTAANDFAKAGYPTKFRIYPKVGHTFPINCDAELHRALDYALLP